MVYEVWQLNETAHLLSHSHMGGGWYWNLVDPDPFGAITFGFVILSALVCGFHKRFSEVREEVEDDEHPGRNVTSRNEEKVQKINEIVWKDRPLSIQMIAGMVNINKETVQQILHDELNMTKVCAKLVPKNLAQDQKDNQNICSDIMERLTEEPDLLTHVITSVFSRQVHSCT